MAIRTVHLLVLALVVQWPACRPLQPTASWDGESGFLTCDERQDRIRMRDRIETLNALTGAHYAGCDEVVIKYGRKALDKYKHKTYFWSREITSVFIPEHEIVDYVMESYERGYLSFLIALSYLRSGEDEEAQVELRRMDRELAALIYNYGEDPVNTLLQAALWDRFGDTHESWVDWNRLRESDHVAEAVRTFADQRMDEIDGDGNSPLAWKVYAVGTFPKLDWDLKFNHPRRGYFRIRAADNFLEDCASASGVRISTRSWFSKIAMRHHHRYHRLLHAKTWIRLPFGMAYAVATATSGAALMVSGCVTDFALSAATGGQLIGLCKVSIVGGAAVIEKAPEVMADVIQPDLRHWEHVPEAIIVTTRDDPSRESCGSEGRGLWKLMGP